MSMLNDQLDREEQANRPDTTNLKGMNVKRERWSGGIDLPRLDGGFFDAESDCRVFLT